MWGNSNSPHDWDIVVISSPLINKRDTEMTLMMTRPDSSTTCMENNTSSCDNMRWKTSKIYIFHSVRLFINRGVWSYNIWPNEMKKSKRQNLGILVIMITIHESMVPSHTSRLVPFSFFNFCLIWKVKLNGIFPCY
jgi:hypothetical protein